MTLSYFAVRRANTRAPRGRETSAHSSGSQQPARMLMLGRVRRTAATLHFRNSASQAAGRGGGWSCCGAEASGCGGRERGFVERAVERVGIGGQAGVLEHLIARPALPEEVTAHVEVVVQAVAQPLVCHELDRAERRDVVGQADLERCAGTLERD